MKSMFIKLLACILACMMLCTSLVACVTEIPGDTETGSETDQLTETEDNTENAETDSDTAGENSTESEKSTEKDDSSETTADDDTDVATESASDTDNETESETETETETETEAETDYQIITKDTLTPAYVLVEGESFTSSTFGSVLGITQSFVSDGAAQSGGKIFYMVHTPDEWLNLKAEDIETYEWTKPLSVTYQVNIPYTGYYKFLTKTGDINTNYTTNFSVVIDKKQTIVGAECEVKEEVEGADQHGGLFQILDLGVVYLTKGTHRFSFELDWEDAFNDPGPTWERRLAFVMDYFSLSRVYSENDLPTLSYNTDISGEENVEVLKNAANVYVFDSSYPIRMDYVQFFEKAGTTGYSITDFYGNVIYQRYFNGEANDIRKVELGISKHPTGYFTLRAGENVIHYVVTPSLADRTLEDTPFAMDFASLQLVGDVEDISKLSAALRLAGVTWVRERFVWSSYQKNFENGVSTFHEENMNIFKSQLNAIDKAGLKTLLVVAGNHMPWINKQAIELGSGTDDPVTDSNQLGYYGTQLAIYDGMKKIATELNGIVDILEMSNEPDHYRRDLAETYSSWFKAAALGAIDSGADMLISIAGMCIPSNEKDFIALAMSSDVMKYSSIFNYHSHSYRYPGTDNMPDYALTGNPTLYGSSLTLFGVDKPIWITESGIKLPTKDPSEEEKAVQAGYLVSSTVQSLAYGTDKHFWFVGSPFIEGEGDFGSFTPEHQPYPTIAAHAVMSDILGEAKYIGELADLPDEGRGYLFDNGENIVAVLWMHEGQGAYLIKTTDTIVKTDLMGKSRTYTPNNGEVYVNLDSNPIYITYTKAPTDYLKQSFEDYKLEMPEVEPGDYVVITPEFEGYKYEYEVKEIGHKLEDGNYIKVRVVNHGSVAVTGKVSATIPGFELEGLDTEITVEPHSEGYIHLILRQTDDTIKFDDHVVFTGKFKIDGKEYDCSPTAVHVYNVAREKREISVSYDSSLKIDDITNVSALKNASLNIQNFEGKIVIKVNETDFEKFTFKDNKLVMDLSDLEVGKYYISIGCITEGGDQQVVHLSLRVYGDTVRFGRQW